MKKSGHRLIALGLTLVFFVLLFTGCVGQSESALMLSGDAKSFVFTTSLFNTRFDLAYYFEHHIEARAEEFDLLIIGHDGFAARIAGDELDGVMLIHTRNGWDLRSGYHPPSVNVDNIASIVVVSTGDDPHVVRFIDTDEQVRELTAGQLRLLDHRRIFNEEGTSQRNNRSVTVYTTSYRVPLADVLPGDSFVTMARSGQTEFFRGAAYLQSGQNQMDLALPNGEMLRDIVGVMADPPGFLVTELFHDAMRFLQQGERVLAIKLDGLGWNQLDYAPFIQSLEPRRALTVYPPVTPSALASMLTGETPDTHGIQGRGTRELAAPDIFEQIEALELTAAHIGARNSFIQTSLMPQLSLSDADGFMLAMQHLDYDFVFVHFKEIDVAGHAYGPHAEQTQQTIAEIDGYVRTLVEQFDGRVIITSDHGMHETADGGGNHYRFMPEDMFVPYVVH